MYSKFCVIFKYVSTLYKCNFSQEKYDWILFYASDKEDAYEKFLKYNFIKGFGLLRNPKDYKKDFKVLDIKKFNTYEEEEKFRNDYWNDLIGTEYDDEI